MQHSDSIAKLSAALVKVQGEIEHAHKNATNPHFRNRYADLTEVIDTVRPVLTKNGIAVVQIPGYTDGVTTLETILTHESGEWMAGTAGARVQKDDPQGVGSALTYLRRYSLAAVCGIGQDDDDGEAASQGRSVRAEATRYSTPAEHGGAPLAPAQRPSSEPAGAKNGNVFDLDAPAKGKKANGKTWRELIVDAADGRGYVRWCIANMAVLDQSAKEALQLALTAAELGDPDFSGDLHASPLPASV